MTIRTIPSRPFFASLLKTGSLLCLLLLAYSPSGYTQDLNALSRVSTAERSDGKGYVVRFHLEEKIDSFKVIQPQKDLIQMTLYSEQVSSSEIAFDTTTAVYDEIGFNNLPFGVGVDLYLPGDNHFKGNAYFDSGSSDLLLGLTRTDPEELEYLTEGLEPVIWSQFTIPRDSLLQRESEREQEQELTDTSYEQIKDKMKFDVVVIDPGHGGHDPGAIGYKGVREKHVVMDIAKKLGGYINEYLPEVKVVYTREDDSFVGLEERGRIANKAEGDLFVSIHCNVFRNRNARGSEIFFLGLHRSQAAFEVMKKENSVIRFEEGPDRSEELTEEDLLIYELANSGYMATSEKLAGMMEYQLDERAQRYSRGVKQAGFIVLFHASMPAVLVESGFISNPSEQRYLSSDYGQSIIASALFRAIRNYKEEYERSQNFNTN